MITEKYIHKISDEKLKTCECCNRFTTGHEYGNIIHDRFDPFQQFENVQFFCTPQCAEQKTGKTIIE